MVNHKLGYKLLLSDILPQFEDIKNRIGVTDEVFIEHLEEWNTDLDKYITKNNIKDVIPDASFYDLTTKISLSLIHISDPFHTERTSGRTTPYAYIRP